MDEKSHGPLLPKVFPQDMVAGIDAAVNDSYLFARQPNDAFDHQPSASVGMLQCGNFPAPRPAKLECRAVDQDAIAGEHFRRHVGHEVRPAIRADHIRGVFRVQRVDGERGMTLRAGPIDVAAHAARAPSIRPQPGTIPGSRR